MARVHCPFRGTQEEDSGGQIMTEVKYIRPELIEAIARNTLKNYDASLILGYEAKSVPIEDN